MSTGSIIAMVVSICGGLAGIVFGVLSRTRDTKKDNTEDGKQSGIVLTELGYIKAGVDDVKRKQDKQDEQTLGILRELTAVQESAKQAHHRIDGLETMINEKQQ